MYSLNFTVTRKTFCLSLHYNGANSYLFLNVTEIHEFKAKDSKIVATLLCLGNISKDSQQIISKRPDLMATFIILVLTIMTFKLMILSTFIST